LLLISDEDRREDLEVNLVRGNHKLAALHSEQIEMMLKDKVECGWQLLLPRQAIHSIPNAMILAPLGIVEQETINE
jgi:hypothetical protein